MEFSNNPLKEIRKEGRLFILTALISVANLENKVCGLEPSKLAFDIYATITTRKKEEIEENDTQETTFLEGEEFLIQYKALCGHLLQNKYKYKDFYEGGLSLLNKDELLKRINSSKDVDEIKSIIWEEYNKQYVEEKEKKELVNSVKYLVLRIVLVAAVVLLFCACGYIIFNHLRVTKIDKATIKSQEAYLDKDYPKCLEAMKSIEIADIDEHTRKIMAISMVKTDNLTQEQKDNISLDISNSETAILFDYWVYISRNQYENAETIAKQLSDDELLLYAYMKEAVYLKNNTSIEGEEKATRINVVEGEIDKLSKTYEEKPEQ